MMKMLTTMTTMEKLDHAISYAQKSFTSHMHDVNSTELYRWAVILSYLEGIKEDVEKEENEA